MHQHQRKTVAMALDTQPFYDHLQSFPVTKLSSKKKKKKIYLRNESHIKLNQINAKGGLPEEQTLINAGRPYNITIM